MSYEEIIYQKEGRIADIVLNRPAKMNAMSFQTIREILAALADAEDDENVGVLVFSGAGEKAFSAGDDVKDKESEFLYNCMPGDKFINLRGKYIYHMLDSVRSVMKPVIAQVHGWCIGGGLDVALASDIIIASETAKFSYPYVSIGVVSGTALIPRVVGYHRACELMFTGDLIDAREAERIGLVNHVVPQEELHSTVRALAEKLAQQVTPLVGWTKWALNKASGDYKEALDWQSLANSLFHSSKYIPRLVQREGLIFSQKKE